MKRLISILFALVLLAGLMIGVVSADEVIPGSRITSIDVTVGTEIGQPIGVTLGENLECVYANYSWYDNPISEEEPIGYGQYKIQLLITAAEGYVLAEDSQLILNGYKDVWAAGWELWESSMTDDGYVLTLYKDTTVGLQENYGVEIYVNLDEINADKAVEVPEKLDFYSYPENSAFISDIYWEDANGQRVEGVFQANQYYYLTFVVEANEGYYFTPWNKVVSNRNSDCTCDGGKTMTARFTYSTFAKLDTVEVFVDDIVAGQPLPVPTVPEGANYHISEYRWWDEANGESAQTAEDGHKYHLDIVLLPAEGYASSINTELRVNGETPNNGGGTDGKQVYISHTDSLLTPVEPVEIFMDEPEIGKAPPVPTVPEGANYKIDYYEWMLDEEGMWGQEITTLENGHRYFLVIEILPKEGYEFVIDSLIYLNGEEYNNIWDSSRTNLGISYSYLTKIEQAEITVADPQIGSAPSVPTVPEGADYTVDYYWYDQDGNEVTQIEDGKKYYLNLNVLVKEGCEFKDPALLINGKKANGFGWSNDHISYTREYSFMETVDEAQITVEEPQIGAVPGVPTVPADANYVIESYKWTDADGKEVTKFEDGKLYHLQVNIALKPGYETAERFDVTINGEWPNAGWGNGGTTVEINHEYSFLKEIEKVEITVEDAVVGAEPAKPTIPADANYEIEAFMWWDDNGNAVTKFEDGKAYYLEMSIVPKAGYSFEGVDVLVNGEYPDNCHTDTTSVYIQIKYSFRKQLDKAEISTVEPVIGAKPVDPTIAENANYEIEFYWYDHNWNEVSKFEDGKAYRLEIHLYPKEGYEFPSWNDETELTVLVNGQEAEREYYDYDNGVVHIRLEYSFRTVIDRVDLTAPELVLGGTIDLDAVELKTEHCEIADIMLFSTTSSYDPADPAVKDRYALNINLQPEDGYEFAEDVVIYINGVALENINVWGDAEWIGCTKYFDFRDDLDVIDLPALPVAKPGEKPVIEIEIPEDALYSVDLQWVSLEGENIKTFEEGEVYYLYVRIAPATGYRLPDDLVFTIGGEEPDGVYQYSSEAIVIFKQYDLGGKVIDKVDLKLEEPADGKKPGEITVSDDAHCTVESFDWGFGTTDQWEDADGMKKGQTFAYGNYYWIVASLEAEEGYVFSEDLVITVNGKPIELVGCQELGTITPLGSSAIVVGNLGQLVNEEEEPKPPIVNGNPSTGDSALLSVLAVLSVTGLAVTVVSKKRFF